MLRFFVSNKKDSLPFEHSFGLLEFGREAKPGCPRIVLSDPYVSSSHLRVEELPGGRVQITNLSKRRPVMLADGREIGIGAVSNSPFRPG